MDEQLKQFKEFVGRIDADLRVRCAALEETVRNEYVKGANERVDAKFTAMENAIKQYSSAIAKNLNEELAPKLSALEEKVRQKEQPNTSNSNDQLLTELKQRIEKLESAKAIP